MKRIFNDFKEIYKAMNPVSRGAIKYGTSLILTLFIMAAYFYIDSIFAQRPYFSIELYTALLYSAKECMGAVYVLPMVGEVVLMATGRKRTDLP